MPQILQPDDGSLELMSFLAVAAKKLKQIVQGCIIYEFAPIEGLLLQEK